jgi:hypothetical protein
MGLVHTIFRVLKREERKRVGGICRRELEEAESEHFE